MIPDVRLEPSRPHLNDRDVTPDNAYYYIRQITNFIATALTEIINDEIQRFQQDHRSEQEFPALNDWEASNPEFLALLRQIQAIPNSQVPTIDSIHFPFPYASPILAVTRLFAYLNERDAHNGEWQPAWERFMLGVEICERIMPGGGLIYHLVAQAGQNRLRQSLRQTSWRNTPPPELADEMIAYLMQMHSRLEPFVEAMRYEYVYASLVTDAVWRAPSQLHLLADGVSQEHLLKTSGRHMLSRPGLAMIGSTPSKTRHHIDAVFSQLIASIEAGRTNEFDAEFERIYATESLRVGFFLSDPIGRILVALMIPAVSNAHHRVLYAEMDGAATATVIALARYRDDHGGDLPDRLEYLVPHYLPRLPADLYRPGQPLIYRAEDAGFRLYSVGPNGTDNGGEHHYFGADKYVRPLSDLLFLFTD